MTSTMYSGDARFVLSGSDEGNVRIWKAKASERLGVVTARERAAIEYRNKLKERWAVDTEVARISRYAFSEPFIYIWPDNVIDRVICRKPFGPRTSSDIPWWRLAESRRRGEESIQEQGIQSRRQRRRKLCWQNKHSCQFTEPLLQYFAGKSLNCSFLMFAYTSPRS